MSDDKTTPQDPDQAARIAAYEKLGAFYLGRPIESESGKPADPPLLYDAKDLTTHAVIVGMTGSGKTGLGITLLEEAAIDGVPALIIDPKGDLGNLLLTFPDLAPGDFEPWVDPAKAAREGLSVPELSAREAATWTKGLASWGQDGARIGRLRDAVEMAIYTPGSSSGRPVSILSSFAAPEPEILDDADLLGERITTTVSSLLGLLGIDADPVQSREHILLSTLLGHAWGDGEDLDLAGLIQQVQSPPVQRVGVLPVDTFFPQKDRFALAMRINALLAAPSFQSWLEGEPLDVDRMLYTADGKPRLAIFSIAHLGDAERMFFVSLLLSQTLGWMRRQQGTSSLRALLYMDEVFGYLPPVGAPPSKRPLLTLLKQARAFGFGVVLSTQNPVDLDYKALSNIGTWFLGRLQTERDQARVMDGLLGTDVGFEKSELESILAGLEKRTFLLHNVHEDGPELFYVRWAMSYLCGPLTRRQIRRLLPPSAENTVQTEKLERGDLDRSTAQLQDAAEADTGAQSGAGTTRPMLPGATERFVPAAAGAAGAPVVYTPGLLGAARVHFEDRKHDVQAMQEVVFWVEVEREDVDWYEAREIKASEDELTAEPVEDAYFREPAGVLGDAKKHKAWEKDFADFLYRTRRWTLAESAHFGVVQRPRESEGEFRRRIDDLAREERDLALAKARKESADEIAKHDDKLRRAADKLEKEGGQTKDKWLKVGSNSLELLLSAAGVGRKRLTANKIGRLWSSVGRAFGERSDDKQVEATIAELETEVASIRNALESREEEIKAAYEGRRNEELGTYEIEPRRTDIDVRLIAVGWVPWQRS